MGTAGQVGFGGADAREEPVGNGEVHGLTGVGSAGESQFLGTQPEGVEHSVFHQRQGLKRLRGGPPERHQVGGTRGRREVTISGDHGSRDPVDGLRCSATQGLDSEFSHGGRET
jgi:hypothetical protein